MRVEGAQRDLEDYAVDCGLDLSSVDPSEATNLMCDWYVAQRYADIDWDILTVQWGTERVREHQNGMVFRVTRQFSDFDNAATWQASLVLRHVPVDETFTFSSGFHTCQELSEADGLRRVVEVDAAMVFASGASLDLVEVRLDELDPSYPTADQSSLASDQSSARDMLYDLLSEALLILRNVVASDGDHRLSIGDPHKGVCLAHEIDTLPGLLRPTAAGAPDYRAVILTVFGDSVQELKMNAKPERAHARLTRFLLDLFLWLRRAEARELQLLGNAMHNLPDQLQAAAESRLDYKTIAVGFMRHVPPDYRDWALELLLDQHQPDPGLVDLLERFDSRTVLWNPPVMTATIRDIRRKYGKLRPR